MPSKLKLPSSTLQTSHNNPIRKPSTLTPSQKRLSCLAVSVAGNLPFGSPPGPHAETWKQKLILIRLCRQHAVCRAFGPGGQLSDGFRFAAVLVLLNQAYSWYVLRAWMIDRTRVSCTSSGFLS